MNILLISVECIKEKEEVLFFFLYSASGEISNLGILICIIGANLLNWCKFNLFTLIHLLQFFYLKKITNLVMKKINLIYISVKCH